MSAPRVKLKIGEQIDRARDGRSQKSIVEKLNDMGISITEVQFTRKKKGPEEFTSEELAALSEILGTELTIN